MGEIVILPTRPTNREEWLQARKLGIGASDASSVVGMNPYKTNVELWEEKVGLREPTDISGKPYVQYGIDAERPLRELFALDYPQYDVTYKNFDMHYNEQYPFIFATLDGDLTELLPIQRKGVLEIKTTEILRSMQYENWKEKIPDNYYIQVLHQLLSTGYCFAILKAQLKTSYNGDIRLNTRHYKIERSEVEEDLDYLLKEEIRFWDYVERKQRPNLLLPAI